MKNLNGLVVHMRRVQAAAADLRDLGLLWRMIESSAAISCPDEVATILPTLIGTRERFEALQRRLVDRMAIENQAELADDLTAKAQCAIDILVRNLYERTADVGFLATDEVVREFCSPAQPRDTARSAAMAVRLRAYQAKYTVYDDIVLLGPGGEVLARLDEAAPLARSADPLVQEALQAPGYVERFRPSDMAPDAAPALLYAHRIEQGNHPVGVLVLRFRFQDEMQRIFADVAHAQQEVAVVLLGDDQRVIVSNDSAHVPPGALLRALPSGEMALTSFAGREYLAINCASRGYQGYAGPGWRAQAMVSVLTAFRQDDAPDVTEREGDAALNVPLDNTELVAICRDADAINRDLRRVVWNGRLASQSHGPDPLDATLRAQGAEGARLKAVLNQVNQTGVRTRDRVDRATKDLYRTSIGRVRRQCVDLARLAADVLDRNLYERANDCRWWALSPALQQALAGPADAAGTARLNAVLDHINSLYTVYSRLVVFDHAGSVRGASQTGAAPGLIGSAIDDRWLQATSRLNGEQQYAVSGFEPTALHCPGDHGDQGDTYVYLAAIRSPDGATALGGIAIVFNAQRELAAMLGDVLGQRIGAASFVDASGRVLASTDASLARGQMVQFAGTEALVEHAGAHYACARVRAAGYREFKTSDGYDNQVSAIVVLRLGAAERRQSALSDRPLATAAPARAADAQELALFQVGSTRYALPVGALWEAVSPHGLVRTPGASPLALGLLEAPGLQPPRLVQVLCGRRLFGVAYPARASDGVVLLLRSPRDPSVPVLGLRVDDLLVVLSADRHRLHPPPRGVSDFAPWVASLLDCTVQRAGGGEDPALVQVLDAAQLIAQGLGARAASRLSA